jgi:hypothetical protein
MTTTMKTMTMTTTTSIMAKTTTIVLVVVRSGLICLFYSVREEEWE